MNATREKSAVINFDGNIQVEVSQTVPVSPYGLQFSVTVKGDHLYRSHSGQASAQESKIETQGPYGNYYPRQERMSSLEAVVEYISTHPANPKCTGIEYANELV